MAFDDNRKGPHAETNEDGVLSQHPGYIAGFCACGTTFLRARTAHVKWCLGCQYLNESLDPLTAGKAVK